MSNDLNGQRAGGRNTPSAQQLVELDRLLGLCEVQSVRSGLPFPLGATVRGNGVNFAIFSRHASGVRLDLFERPEDANPQRTIILDDARNKTGDIWHVWLEGIAPGQLYGFRVAGPYSPHEGHRFNPDKLVVDPYATAIAPLPGCDLGMRLATTRNLRKKICRCPKLTAPRPHRSVWSHIRISTGTAINPFVMPGNPPLSMNCMCGGSRAIQAPALHSRNLSGAHRQDSVSQRAWSHRSRTDARTRIQ